MGSHGGMYRPPNSNEVFHLPDAANAAIPEDIRNQFQSDSHSRVLFFTTPPVPKEAGRKRLAHTPRYLAWKAKEAEAQKALKRKSEEREDEQAGAGADMDGVAEVNGTNGTKRVKTDDQADQGLSEDAIKQFTEYMADLAVEGWKSLYPTGSEGWRADMLDNLRSMGAVWEEHAKDEADKQAKAEEAKGSSVDAKVVGLTGLMDYRPPNERLEWGRK
jgi:chromatin structure-remodeling complex subunit RSC1/2